MLAIIRCMYFPYIIASGTQFIISMWATANIGKIWLQIITNLSVYL